jgi:hypothetical protein
VLGDGGDVPAGGVPVAGDLLGAEPARDLLLGLRGPQVAFRLTGRRRYPQVGGEAEHVSLPVAQAFQQVAAGLLLAAGNAGDLGQAGQDPVPERVDRRRGDVVRHRGQALGAGGVRGVDQALQRDVHDLVRGGHAQVSRGCQVRAAPARAPREVRHHVIRALGPGQVRSRGAWLLAGSAPTPAALRLRRRQCAAGQVITRRRHRGIPAVTAQTTLQIPDLRRQRHHMGPQLPDRGGLLLKHPGLLADHRVPGSARRATRRRGWQANHNRPSSSPALSSQAATPGRL